MQYLMLVRVGPDAHPTPEEADPTAWVEESNLRGVRLRGDRLRPAGEATTVRVRDGQTVVTDGPYAELREQIAGFDLLEVTDKAHAIRVASAHPAARFGVLELRAIWPFGAGE